jgi:hypothetical protein
MAETDTTAAARAQLATDKAARAKSQQEYEERMQGKPTPTQEENDLAALGAHVMEKEPDGSAPDPNVHREPAPKEGEAHRRQIEAQKPGSDYLTRQSRPARSAEPTRPAGE